MYGLEAAILVDSCRREVMDDPNLCKLPEPFFTIAVETLCAQRPPTNYRDTETKGEFDFNEKSNKRQRQRQD
jgi:hypothetical protein